MTGGIGLAAKHVAERVDEKSAVLRDHDAADAGDQESTEGTGPRVQAHGKV